MTMLRFVPPAGTPLKIRQILHALNTTLSANGQGKKSLSLWARELRVPYIFGASSGRAALWLILKSLVRLRPERNVVALPAYTCFSVAAAVVRAGLKVQPLEVDPHTLDFDFSQLKELPEKNLLCVITSNLFGFMNDLPRIRKTAHAKGAFVLDDAAQALGAVRYGEFAGTLGDVGLYSLGRGKAVAAMEGGLIVTHSEEIARVLAEEAKNLRAPSLVRGARLLLDMVAYSLLLKPRLYWLPNSLPFLGLGTTEFNPEFRTGELHALSQALLPCLLEGLQQSNEIRRANARLIAEALQGNPHFEFPAPYPHTQPTFVRFPVLAADKTMREWAVARLCKAGIGASSFYPSAICDIPGLEAHACGPDFHCKEAESLSQRLFTLPVNPLVNSRDIERMAALLAAA